VGLLLCAGNPEKGLPPLTTCLSTHPRFIASLPAKLQAQYPIVSQSTTKSNNGLLVSRQLYSLMRIQIRGPVTFSEFGQHARQLQHERFYQQHKLWLLYKAPPSRPPPLLPADNSNSGVSGAQQATM
jgi:hypothetical protein